jgi:hypothetical protein
MRLSFTSILGSLLILIGIAAAIAYFFIGQYAKIGAGMMAKQMCSCLYVQDRTEGECLAEMDKSIGKYAKYMKIVYFARTLNAKFAGDDGGEEIVAASFPDRIIVSFKGLEMAQSKMEPGFGCSVKNFDGQMPNGLNNVVSQ